MRAPRYATRAVVSLAMVALGTFILAPEIRFEMGVLLVAGGALGLFAIALDAAQEAGRTKGSRAAARPAAKRETR